MWLPVEEELNEFEEDGKYVGEKRAENEKYINAYLIHKYHPNPDQNQVG